ncbi:MAG: HAD-IA family hydrolase [Gemmatimonadales bacterium]
MRRFECSAIVFDLDGVLVDSTAFVEQQWRRWASARGLRAEPFLRVCHGRRAVETIRLAAPQLDAEAEIAAFGPTEESTDVGAAVGPLAGAARLLAALPLWSWGVATSGPREAAGARLRSAGLPVPPVLVCAEDVTRGKPGPDVYLQAARDLRVSPAECLAVEDTPAGVEAAHSAGMPVVAVTTTHRPDQLRADACTRDLAGVHLGRLDRDPRGGWRLEILVVEE